VLFCRHGVYESWANFQNIVRGVFAVAVLGSKNLRQAAMVNCRNGNQTESGILCRCMRRGGNVVRKFILLSCFATAILFPNSQAVAHTRSINIGSFTYLATRTQTESDGTVIAVSSYRLHLDTTGVTTQPISFRDVTLFVKGTKQSSGALKTGPGCGRTADQAPCNLIFAGGPGSKGFVLAHCAKVGKEKLTQTCISIGVQLVSSTGKNFGVALANGRQFCAYGINNIFLLPKPNQTALDPRCDAHGFCKGASVPIRLQAAPARSCGQ
jgi:hypothetical protein